MALMGLDIGTSGSKCTLMNESGEMIGFAYREYPALHPGKGRMELNPQNVWDAVRHVIRSVTSRHPREKVQAISISSFGESAVPIDRKGRILANSILYTDKRGEDQSQKLRAAIGERRIMELTGIPIHPMYTIHKMMWIRDNQPDIYNKTWKFLLFGDFIIFQLTGKPVIDYSLASRTMCLNVRRKAWEPVIFDAAGIDPELLSDLAPSGHAVGSVRKDVAKELGLHPQTVVVTGGHDQACAALGAGVIEEGQAIDGIGTVECIAPTFAKPVINGFMLQHQYNCAPHVVSDRYLSYAFNFTGGSLLRWYRDCFGQDAVSEAAAKGISVYDLWNGRASGKPTDILVVPHFSGSGTPHMDVSAKGTIHGLTLSTTPGELYRSLLEGVTYEMMYNLECLEQAGIQAQTLKAVGGGAKSDLWMQIKADIMGRKVETLNIGEAGTLGAVILAGTACGVYPSCEQAVKQLIHVKKEYVPNPANAEIYRENYERFKRLSALLRQ